MRFIFLIAFFLFYQHALAQEKTYKGAQYQALQLFDMATAADFVTQGVITKVFEKDFLLKCRTAKGTYGNILLKKFTGYKPYDGPYRWAVYKEGQQVVVFLKKTKTGYELLTRGAESEIPIIKDTVIIPLTCFLPQTVNSLNYKKDFETFVKSQTFEVDGKKILGIKGSVSQLLDAVQYLRNCYQILLKVPNTQASNSCFNFFDRYSRDKINTYKAKSYLMRLLYKDMELTQAINCK
jgi:hypothetical protein